MISIIMPAFNSQRTIAESIDSIRNQTYKDFELVVIDDGSVDKTPQIAGRYAGFDSRVRLVSNGSNQGAAFSRNHGIQISKGGYIAFCDSDDLWDKRKLEKQLAFMAEHNARISYTASTFIDTAGKKYSYVLPAPEKLTLAELRKHNLMSCSSVMVERELMLRYPFPVTARPLHEDAAVWQSILKEVGVAYGLDEPLLIYRMVPESKSRRRFTSAVMTYNAYRESSINPIVSAFYTLRYALYSIKKWRRVAESAED